MTPEQKTHSVTAIKSFLETDGPKTEIFEFEMGPASFKIFRSGAKEVIENIKNHNTFKATPGSPYPSPKGSSRNAIGIWPFVPKKKQLTYADYCTKDGHPNLWITSDGWLCINGDCMIKCGVPKGHRIHPAKRKGTASEFIKQMRPEPIEILARRDYDDEVVFIVDGNYHFLPRLVNLVLGMSKANLRTVSYYLSENERILGIKDKTGWIGVVGPFVDYKKNPILDI